MQNTKRPEMVGADVEKIFQGIAEGCLMVRFAARSAHMKSWKNISGGRRGQASGAPRALRWRSFSSECIAVALKVQLCVGGQMPAGIRQT